MQKLNPPGSSREWLETDGNGGFASGTVSGIRTRRYHALLLTATTPPTGRVTLVNGFEAWIETPKGRFALTSQHYAPDVIHPEGADHINCFTGEPWPTWRFKFEDCTELVQELFIAGEAGVTALNWRLTGEQKNARLFVRPLISGRDYHALHHENNAFNFTPSTNGEKILFRPYDGVPGVYAMYSSNGCYTQEPVWYRNFLYSEERARGLDDVEDLASPGIFEWDLSTGDAVWLLTTSDSQALARKRHLSVKKFFDCLRENERLRRAEFQTPLHRAADAYVVGRVARRAPQDRSVPVDGAHGVSRPTAKTILAGYPWFTDWGRDTFIALRGLCLATGRLEVARDILLAWTGSVSEGMLPNRFPDHGQQPEYNSVDASLWFIVAVHELLHAARGQGIVSAQNQRRLQSAIEEILEGYSRGTRFGIRMDADGLLAAGEPGVQLTWMDAKVGDWVVTPRVGKPVEVQALWLNALRIASQFSPGWQKHFERGLKSFREKFWNDERGCLFDVVDVDHRAGVNDGRIRPNQVLAAGGLPFALLEGERAKRLVAVIEEKLLTPLGLCSLAPGEPDYQPRYEGGVRQRDGAYHQGTVWPWLIGPFVEAWLRVREKTVAAKSEARKRFLAPLLVHLAEAGLGHVSEIADAEPPHTPRGCPWQAWSLGELLRLDLVVLEAPKARSRRLKEPRRVRSHQIEAGT